LSKNEFISYLHPLKFAILLFEYTGPKTLTEPTGHNKSN